MKLLIVRHGQTDQNVRDTNGNAGNDLPLNKIGINQAKKVAADLHNFKPTVIYSSPKQRAMQTAHEIAQICCIEKVNVSDLLQEFDMGEWGSLSSSELKEKIMNDKHWANGRPSFEWAPPGGESWAHLQERAALFLQELHTMQKKSDIVVIVSHNQFIRALRGVALRISFEDWFAYKPNNAEVLEIII